jgi:cytochrome c biogenesis protein CcmG, thiol:disulfide interchange protein DsbE
MPLLKNLLKMIVTGLAVSLAAGALAVEPQQPAPAFSLAGLPSSPAPIALSNYKGKVVYVDFWASWCLPCKQSFPALNHLRQQYHAQGFEVIAINLDENLADAQTFLAKLPVNFPIALDPRGSIAEAYGIRGMPSAYIIDRQGKVRHVIEGFVSDDARKIETWIKPLLSQSP